MGMYLSNSVGYGLMVPCTIGMPILAAARSVGIWSVVSYG
jgi:hypothetical protein